VEDEMNVWIERVTLAAATALTAWTLTTVPSWRGALADPCHQAAIAAAATIAILFATRRMGSRGVALERVVMALFLTGMPLIYIASWLVTGGGGSGRAWLAIELAGLPVYAALALLGLRRSAWYLAAGIAAHGLGWDVWHLHSDYIPRWYAIGCLLVDVGLALHVAARAATWRSSARPASHPRPQLRRAASRRPRPRRAGRRAM
jgi:hypothetical protein